MDGRIESLNSGDAKWHKVEGVQVFARRDDQSRPTRVDSIDENQAIIKDIADQLQRGPGYGVLRERVSRAGRISHRLKALWSSPGSPPEDPFELKTLAE